MFRETTNVRLPDGTVVGNRAIGNARAAALYEARLVRSCFAASYGALVIYLVIC